MHPGHKLDGPYLHLDEEGGLLRRNAGTQARSGGQTVPQEAPDALHIAFHRLGEFRHIFGNAHDTVDQKAAPPSGIVKTFQRVIQHGPHLRRTRRHRGQQRFDALHRLLTIGVERGQHDALLAAETGIEARRVDARLLYERADRGGRIAPLP